MNQRRTDRRLNAPGWRRRYQAAFSSLLHFRLTLQALSLPEDSAPEQLSQTDLEAFLRRLLGDLDRFTSREIRYLSSSGSGLRSWRLGALFPLLDLFDETQPLGSAALPGPVAAQWRQLAGDFVHLKALVVRRHVWD